MTIQEAYNKWAVQYDTNPNKTRDLEAIAKKEMLSDIPFSKVLEIGCGTGKNTLFLIQKAALVWAIDLSEEMLAQARQKVGSDRVVFKQADITKTWNIDQKDFDLVTFSLVLEHIEDLDYVFRQVATCIRPGGFVYVGELHPFKQYSGSKARFETEDGHQIVTCFTHHISDFTKTAGTHGFDIVCVNECFDLGERTTIPRILCLLFRKSPLQAND